jgi:hypothetical protein
VIEEALDLAEAVGPEAANAHLAERGVTFH